MVKKILCIAALAAATLSATTAVQAQYVNGSGYAVSPYRSYGDQMIRDRINKRIRARSIQAKRRKQATRHVKKRRHRATRARHR